ncbi:FhaA domain-containing protein [uncultured Senegalimassilia sp.]|uniref:FhaA domain-containing protein n=1 Tax=uncultured Senegalimassilia sp. TaxID=1714350 RepID=UPI0027DD9CDC|nr:FhaA domain-containing protein [uncultured Senegalimassilia sp.]
MGIFSKFEGKMEDTFEGTADKMFDAPISPVQIAKKAEKQMRREKMVGAGKQYAPTLYTVLVNPDDDRRLFGYYPTLAGETETYLAAKASEQGLTMDGQPLVRFIVDEGLKHGKFDVIAEAVAAPIISQLRNEEMERYGLGGANAGYGAAAAYPAQQFGRAGAAMPDQRFNQYDQYDQHDQYGQYDQYDQYGNQGYQQMPAGNGWEAQGYQAPAQESWDQPAAAPDYAAAQQAAAGAVDQFNAYAAGAAPAAAAAGYAAGQAAAAAPRPQAMPQQAANTVMFAGAGVPGQQPAQPQQASRARLIDTAANRAIDLASARVTLGRESRNDITIPDINVSRTHAEISLSPQGAWVITDLGSTNGTYVNGRAVASQPLNEGDHIAMGSTNFVFTLA